MMPNCQRALWRLTLMGRVIAARIRAMAWRARGAQLGAKVNVGPRCLLDHPWGLHAAHRVVFERNVYIKIGADEGCIDLGPYTFLGSGVEINALAHVRIGAYCLLAPGCFVVDHSHGMAGSQRINQQPCQPGPIQIGDDVWIGANAVILPHVRIGDGAVVAANAVVRENVPAGAIVAGVPARVKGYRKDRQIVRP